MKRINRNKKGQFTKTRKALRTIKLLAISFIIYKYFEPAIELVWNSQAAPYLAQLIK